MRITAANEATDARVNIRRVIHTIHAVSNIAACRAKYLDILGGLIFAEGYFEAEDRDMALLYVANYMACLAWPDRAAPSARSVPYV